MCVSKYDQYGNKVGGWPFRERMYLKELDKYNRAKFRLQ